MKNAILATYVHDLNPFLFRVGDGFGPRWYGLAYLAGFLAAYLLLAKLAKEGFLRIPRERVADLVLNVCIFGVLLGGRLGYVLFYDPRLLGWAKDSAGNIALPYWGVLKVWEGGMSAHGGVVGTIIVLIIFARRNKYSLANIGDAACMVTPLGLLFGRIANFINGELYGHSMADPAGNTPWWRGVKFPTELISPTNNPEAQEAHQRLLVQLPELVFQVNRYAEHKTKIAELIKGDSLDQMARHLVELVQGTLPVKLDPKVYADIATYAKYGDGTFHGLHELLPTRYPSQLYEASLEGLALFVICWLVGRWWRRDGMAAGAFLVGYPVMRIIGEQYRVGDTPLNIGGVWLGKGVVYSVPMIVGGVLWWLYWMRKPARVAAAGAAGTTQKKSEKSGS